MWRTSCGERILHGAEARLFAEALLSLLDDVQMVPFEDYELGLSCFDNLTYGQKISVLSTIGNGLLREDVPAVPLTAVLEGAIAAVFQHLRDCIAFETDESDMGTDWRQWITAALREMEAEDVPDPTCADESEWDIAIQELWGCILWDADYEDGDLYLDQPPDLAMKLRSQMRIPDDYFAAIADDLTEEQAVASVAELRIVCAGVIGS